MTTATPYRLLVALAIGALAGCGANNTLEAGPTQTGATAGGKADDGITSTTQGFGKTTCSFSTPWLVDSSHDLAEDSDANKTKLVFEDAERLEGLAQGQLLAAATHLEAVSAGATLAQVFENVDDHTLFTRTATLEGRSFDWVQFFLGDTEVGVVFDAGTLNIVAEIGDGDIQSCVTEALEPKPPTCEETAELTCHWDIAWHAESSFDLKDATLDSQDIDSASKLDPVVAEQLVAAALLLQAIEPGQGVDEALAADDEGTWRVSTVRFDGATFDWFKAHMGDTEVGVVFETGTTTIVAEIGDGDVKGCQMVSDCPPDTATEPEPEITPGPAASCGFDTEWLTDTSTTLWDVATQATELNADSSLDALVEAQLLAAAIHLQGMSADQPLSAAFDAVDEGTWTRSSVDLQGQSFEWLQAWMGDTEVGVVFTRGTTTIVAEIGDGEVMGCSVP